MPFTSAKLDLIDATLGALVRRRRPPQHLRDQLDLELEVDGHKVRIFTVRPRWSDPTKPLRLGIAQLTYTRTRDASTLYWMRRDGKWQAWDPDENRGTLPDLVRVVDEDRRGGFWG